MNLLVLEGPVKRAEDLMGGRSATGVTEAVWILIGCEA